MREHDALLAAIHAHPHEDTPRLALADWLDENLPDKKPSPAAGPSALAEFIRVQCKLAATSQDDPEYIDLLDRERDLNLWLNVHAPPQREPVGMKFDINERHRGFLYLVASEDGEGDPRAVSRLVAALRKATATSTANGLRLYEYTGSQMGELLRDPITLALRTLHLEPTYLDDDSVDLDDIAEFVPRAYEAEAIARALAESPHVQNLRELQLSFPLTVPKAEILAGAKHLALADLTLELNADGPGVIRALGRGEWFRNLRAISFVGDIDDPTLVALTRLPPFPNLRTLNLWNKAFGPEAMARLGASKAFPNLLELALSGTRLGPDEVKALARAKWPLAVLHLYRCELGNAGAAALAASPLLEGVRIIDLGDNSISAKGVKALADSPRATALRHLDLSYNPLGKAGLRAIARSPHLRGLTRLVLKINYDDRAKYTTAAVVDFLTRLDVPNLRELTLNTLPVGTSGARVLALSPTFARLTHLNLEDARIDDRGLTALVASPHLRGLIEVRLHGNRIREDAAVLADRKVWPLLSLCDLYSNKIPRATAKKLRKRPSVWIDSD